jgi:tripartite-type tricarboxylate transporter receptor subunit TctC
MRSLKMNSAIAALVALTVSAAAQEWPTRSVTMVVPSAAGSSPDITGRTLAPRLSELLGQPVIVENVGGAGGMIGASRVAKASPDGYQFVLGNAGTHAVNQTLYKNPLYYAATDFAPVALIAEVPVVLIARKDLPANTLQEFIAYAKVNQSQMKFSSSGVGSAPHLACALLNAAIGVKVMHIPYRGGGPAMQDLIAGRIDYQCTAIPIAIPQIEGNLVKAIAILAKNRSSILPGLASAHEQGLRQLEAGSWLAFFSPKGTPAAIVQKLNDAIVATMETPSVQMRLKEDGVVVVARERMSPDYLQQFVKREIDKWTAVIRAAGIEQ